MRLRLALMAAMTACGTDTEQPDGAAQCASFPNEQVAIENTTCFFNLDGIDYTMDVGNGGFGNAAFVQLTNGVSSDFAEQGGDGLFIANSGTSNWSGDPLFPGVVVYVGDDINTDDPFMEMPTTCVWVRCTATRP